MHRQSDFSKRFEALRRRDPRPCADQTPDDIEAYYRNVRSGDPAVIRQTQGGILRYKRTTIADVNPRLGRVYVTDDPVLGGCAFYMRSGANCYHPKGQTDLVVPTQAVLDYIAKHPHGL